MKTPPVVSPNEWMAAREQMLVKEKAAMRARDALVAERRRMPWMSVEKPYEFERPKGKVRLLDLFETGTSSSANRPEWTTRAVSCDLGAITSSAQNGITP